MNTRPVALMAVTALAALGYVGVYRLGRWLDGPLLHIPQDTGQTPQRFDDDDTRPRRARPSEQERSA